MILIQIIIRKHNRNQLKIKLYQITSLLSSFFIICFARSMSMYDFFPEVGCYS